MKDFFTADNHFFHARIEVYCPGRKVLGKTLNERDNEMIRRWNEKVGPNDRVTICGDFAFSDDINVIKALLKKLNGEKHLILGNHDKLSSKINRTWSDYIKAGFTSVQRFKFISVKGIGPVGLAHDPSGCITDPSVPWLVGHLHQQFIRFGNAINVGVDVRDYAPVSLEELAEDFKITLDYHMKADFMAEREILGIE